MPTTLYAVIGRSENQPVLYHMNQSRESAERLRVRREQAKGQPVYVIPMAAWFADPLVALQQAEGRHIR